MVLQMVLENILLNMFMLIFWSQCQYYRKLLEDESLYNSYNSFTYSRAHLLHPFPRGALYYLNSFFTV